MRLGNVMANTYPTEPLLHSSTCQDGALPLGYRVYRNQGPARRRSRQSTRLRRSGDLQRQQTLPRALDRLSVRADQAARLLDLHGADTMMRSSIARATRALRR